MSFLSRIRLAAAMERPGRTADHRPLPLLRSESTALWTTLLPTARSRLTAEGSGYSPFASLATLTLTVQRRSQGVGVARYTLNLANRHRFHPLYERRPSYEMGNPAPRLLAPERLSPRQANAVGEGL